MIRKAAGSACFWLGDLVSKLCDRVEVEWFSHIWYPVYNRLMIWSERLHPELWGQS